VGRRQRPHAKLATGWFILAASKLQEAARKNGRPLSFTAAEHKVFYKKVSFIKKVLS